MEIDFKAPWDLLLIVLSSLFVIIISLPLFLFPIYYNILISIILLLSLLIFIITGYSIKNYKLIVHRLAWKNIFDLSELKSIEINNCARNNSWRLFGIGGAFSYSGIFRNSHIGKYRAYATYRKKSVVLHFRNQVIVVTPDSPENFKNVINKIISNKIIV